MKKTITLISILLLLFAFSCYNSDSDNLLIQLEGDSRFSNARHTFFFPGYDVYQTAIGGDTTENVYNRLIKQDFKADIMFIEVGINDIYYNIPYEKTITNYENIIIIAKQKATHVIFFQIISVNESTCSFKWITNEKINVLNTSLESICLNNGVNYIEIEWDNSYFISDGVHFSDKGYNYITDITNDLLSYEHQK